MHYSDIPKIHYEGLSIQVMVGEFNQIKAPAAMYSPLIGLDIQSQSVVYTQIPLNSEFEYEVLPLTDTIEIENIAVDINTLLYLGCGRKELEIRLPAHGRFLLIGGEPFNEEVLIWWNFVARTKQEIQEAANAWNEGLSFGDVQGYAGTRMNAPVMP